MPRSPRGRSPISWVGPWVYPAYSEAVGDDLIVVPLPDFGGGTKSGNGAWQWGISKHATEPDVVAAFIEYMLSPEKALQWPDAVGQGSPIQSIAAQSKLYGPDGPLSLMTQLLDGGYTVTTSTDTRIPHDHLTVRESIQGHRRRRRREGSADLGRHRDRPGHRG